MTDKYCWIAGRPLLFDGNHNRKASYAAVGQALAGSGTGPTSPAPPQTTTPAPRGGCTTWYARSVTFRFQGSGPGTGCTPS